MEEGDECDLVFRVCVDGEPQAKVYGPFEKRSWVFWKLSDYIAAFSDQGVLQVQRLTEGKWINNDDWHKLTH
jgi:hypothetical protein